MSEVVAALVEQRCFQLLLLGGFAVAALLIASIGIYGLISQSLARRAGEIGIRLAMGATPSGVARLVRGEGLRPVAAELLVGVSALVFTGELIASLLFQVTTTDPIVLLTVTAVLSLVALLACWIPARRAMRLDPAVALRAE